jgi:hypothetical protein
VRNPRAAVHIEVLSGTLQGETLGFEQDRILVGRAPDCALRFDPAADLNVSSHHALLVRRRGGWTVEDVGSTNGTYVDGVQTVGATPLRGGEVIALGRGGPEIRVTFDREARTAEPSTSGEPREAPAGGDGPIVAPWMTAALWVGVACTMVAVIWFGRANRLDWERDRARLMSRVDSLLAVQAALDTERTSALAQLSDSLVRAREEVRRLSEGLEAATSNDDRARIEELQRRLQEAVTLLERQQVAATLDFEGIRRQVEPAVAMIWSELSDGTVLTGTAVSIDRDGTLLTNRHVVAPEGGGVATRLAVQFAGSNQVWRATLIEAHRSADLAWARAEGILGDVPRLDRFNERVDTLALGSAVAVVGFPLGGSPGAEATGARRRAVVSAGILVERGPTELRIQGYVDPAGSAHRAGERGPLSDLDVPSGRHAVSTPPRS